MFEANYLLYGALFMCILTLILWVIAEISKMKKIWKMGVWAMLGNTIFLTIAFFLLIYLFLSSNMNYDYVWNYSKVNSDWTFKLAGTWSGQEGTILMWGWLMSLFATLQHFIFKRSSKAGSTHRGILFVVMVMVLGFIYLMIEGEVFGQTLAIDLLRWPNGVGLNPLLQTPLMLIHPTLEFGAYAMTVFPMAGALIYLLNGDENWSNLTLFWTRLSWLFYSLGLGIGGLWAYYVLSFGGYWAWDPVETANLLPWLILTAMLHFQSRHSKNREHRQILPLMATIPFLLTLFSTFTTRSGWFVSVHAFASLSKEFDLDAASRLLEILSASEGLQAFIAFSLSLFFGFFFLLTRRSSILLMKTGRPLSHRKIGIILMGWSSFLLFLSMFLLIDVIGGLSLLLEGGYYIGFGSVGRGLLILSILLIALPTVSWFYLVPKGNNWSMIDEEEDEAPLLDSIVKEGTLLQSGVLFLGASTFLTLVILLMGVNGGDPRDFEFRALFFLIPLLAGMTIWGAVGVLKKKERSMGFYLAFLPLAIIPIVYMEDWPLLQGLLFAFGLTALLSVSLKFMRLGIDPIKKKTGLYLKIIGPLILIGGLFGTLFWGNPPITTWPFSLGAGENHYLWGFGFIFSIMSLIMGVITARGGGVKTGAIGAMASIISIGYGLSIILGLVSLGIIVFAMSRKGQKPKKIRRRALRGSFKRGGDVLIHMAFALVIVGVSWNSAFVTEVEEDGLTLSERSHSGVFSIMFKEAKGKDRTVQGWFQKVIVTITVFKGTKKVGDLYIRLWYSEQKDHYEPETGILRTFSDDIYVYPVAFYIPGQGWIYAHGNATRFWVDNVYAIAIKWHVQPGMTFVWGGLWWMTIGMTWVLIADTKRSYAPKGSHETWKGWR